MINFKNLTQEENKKIERVSKLLSKWDIIPLKFILYKLQMVGDISNIEKKELERYGYNKLLEYNFTNVSSFILDLYEVYKGSFDMECIILQEQLNECYDLIKEKIKKFLNRRVNIK